MYSFKELNLASDDIPVSMSMIVINGPKTAFSEKELYAIDQFLMRGGNLMFFIDPFDENQNPYTGQSTFTPIDTGLNQILTAYGITPGTDYIMIFDESNTVVLAGHKYLFYDCLIMKSTEKGLKAIPADEIDAARIAFRKQTGRYQVGPFEFLAYRIS